MTQLKTSLPFDVAMQMSGPLHTFFPDGRQLCEAGLSVSVVIPDGSGTVRLGAKARAEP